MISCDRHSAPASFACLAAALLALPALAETDPFTFQNGVLQVRSHLIELKIEAGAVTGIRNRVNGEVFAEGSAWDRLDGVPSGASSLRDAWAFIHSWRTGKPERYGQDKKVQAARRRPQREQAPRFVRTGPAAGELVYSKLSGASSGSALHLVVTIDLPTGEILLKARAGFVPADPPPVSLDIPVFPLKGRSVILGNGGQYFRKDPRWVDLTTRVSNGLYSPNLVVVEGENSVVAVWAEAPEFENCTVYLAHDPEEDALVLDTQPPYGGLAAAQDSSVLESPAWRFGSFKHWLDAARRYRALFEARTGAKPLWEDRCKWARNIHAVDTNIPREADADEYYKRLAAALRPERVLLFYWNGSYIILHGDHRYMARTGRPKPNIIEALKKRGLHWMGYHGYTLLNSPRKARERLEQLASKGELPESYVFTPDYGGPPESFYEYFRPVSGGYYHSLDEARLWVIHAGTKKCREYLVRNLSHYCTAHRMSGAYLDILGSAAGHHFPPEKKALEGLDWKNGEARLLRELRDRLPQIGLMSEYENERTIPHTIYSWTGFGHVSRQKEIGSRVNHPLRTALWGSYTWTRESDMNPADAALIGALPEIDMTDDWKMARAKLFTEEELFNALPSQWPKEALACYRGKNGRQFQFRNLPFGDGFVEMVSGGPKLLLGRFSHVAASPRKRPSRIPGWLAYRNGRPIGLDSGRTYPFLLETPRPNGAFWITQVPPGSFLRALRHAETYSVIEIGAAADLPGKQEVEIELHRACLGISNADGSLGGPYANGSRVKLKTRIPGGLVFLWKEPRAVDARFRCELKQWSGRNLANGIPDNRWSYNAYIQVKTIEVDPEKQLAIHLGYGRHRGTCEAWVYLAKKSEPVLRFSAGYGLITSAQQRRFVPEWLRFAAQLNGTEIWSEKLRPGDKLHPVAIPLEAYAGRKVLLSLTAGRVAGKDVAASHLNPPAIFANVYVDANPLKLAVLDGAALPRPREAVYSSPFAGDGLAPPWQAHLSPAHGKQARLEVQANALSIFGQHYKYAYVARPVFVKNLSVQARLRFPRTGCAPEWNPGIGFLWEGKRFCFFSAGGYRGGDEVFAIRGPGARRIPIGKRQIQVTGSNLYDLWLKIALSTEKVNFYASLDGKQWTLEHSQPRQGDYRKAPRLLALGRGGPGAAQSFSNDERWRTGLKKVFISELFIGRD